MKHPLTQWLAICCVCLLAPASALGQITRFVLFPDTQTYLESCPEILEKQVDVIAGQSKKFDALIHLGDMTQDNHPLEWYTLAKLFQAFDRAKLPYTFTLGNHDMGSAPTKAADTRNTSWANKYFPPEKMKAKPYWGGSFDETVDNHYITLTAGGVDWLILSLEFGPSDEMLEWANQIAASNKHRTIIVNTHAYMYCDSTRMGEGDSWLPQIYGIGKDTTSTVNNGEQMWDKFVSRHPNILAVVSGHILRSGVGTLVSEGKNGNKVYQMLSNYQRGVENSTRVSAGYYRVLTFDKKNHTLEVETISAVTGEKHPSPHHNFIFRSVTF